MVEADAAAACRSSLGTGSNSTSEAIELTRVAAGGRGRRHPAGVPVLQQAHAGRPLQPLRGHRRGRRPAHDHLQHPRAGPAATSSRTTIIRLWEEVPQVVGLKDCSGDLHQTMEIYRATDPETFKIYSGEDIMTFAILCHGGAGAIAAVAHVVGPETRAMCDAVWAGDLAGGPRAPLPHDAAGRRPVRRAQPHPGQAGGGVAGTAGRPAAAAARAR